MSNDDESIDQFIRSSLEREANRDYLEEIKHSLRPRAVREYDVAVNGEIELIEKYRLAGFGVIMVLITPVIIYGMYSFTKDYDCVQDSSESFEVCPIVNLWYNILLLLSLFVTVGTIAGTIAVKTTINVGYTRKMLHFSSFFLPFAVNEVIEVQSHFSITLLKFWLILMIYVLATKPIRRKSYPAGIMFRAIDRPADRPHTLFWLVTQFISSFLVFLPFLALWDSWQDDYSDDFTEQLALIVVLINGLGDGLAEPVGIKFGKYKPGGHSLKYKTRGYWLETESVTDHWYKRRVKIKYDYFTRSYPGSFMVWLVSLVSILALNEPFTTYQLVIGAVFMPILMTLTEAFSPRTWDSPFLFFVGSGLLSILVKIPL